MFVLSTPTFATRPNYAYDRTILAPVPGVTTVQIGELPLGRLDLMDVRVLGRKFGEGSLFSAVYLPVRRTRGDALHLFNQVAFTAPRWGVTFEHCLPWATRLRPDHPLQAALRKPLFSPKCKFVIGISQWSRQFLVDSMTPEEAAAVEDKLFVVPPFQALTGAEPKTALSENQPIILGFVGRNFFHKGGEAVLRAVERSGESLNMRALIVSRAANNDFLTDCVTEGHITEVRERLSSNPRISWYQGLPNREVMVKLATATVGALPTMADTYGYSNLEAMSLGLPIIGTNVQAGSEIVAPDVGWRLDLELRKDGFWAHCGHLTRDVYCDTVDYLAAGIEDAAQQLRELPDILPHLSEGALRRVHDVYNSERAEKMLTILLKTL